MHISKKKNKNILDTISNDDVIRLIKICYKDKLLYGYVKWKKFDTKQFSQKQSVNNFKNIWRQLNKNFESTCEEFSDIIKQIETEVQEINKHKQLVKETEEIRLNSSSSIKSRLSVSNISLLRNFSTVNSSFFNYCSKYYSPLNKSNNDLNSSFLKYSKDPGNKGSTVSYKNKKSKVTSSFGNLNSNASLTNYDSNKNPSSSFQNSNSRTLRKKESGIKKVDYIKRNISDIKKQSELLDYYFVMISLIHQDKKYTLLKKVHELYEVKLLKYSTNQHVKYNDCILHCIRRIYELSIPTHMSTHYKSFSKIGPFTNTSTFSIETHDSKTHDAKNICSIETKEKTYHFNKTIIDFKQFYQIFQSNIYLNNNKVAPFIMPLPRKPSYLIFKNNSFYIFDKIVNPGNRHLEEEVYLYVHIIYKFFITFMFWSFYLKYQGIDKTKQLFNNELEDLYKRIMENIKPQEFYQESKKYRNHPCIISKKRKLEHVTNLCIYVIKLYLKKGKRIDNAYLYVLRIFNMTFHSKHKKRILHSFLGVTSMLCNLIFKLKKRKKGKHSSKHEKQNKLKKRKY